MNGASPTGSVVAVSLARGHGTQLLRSARGAALTYRPI
jgi:hypothetical protein